jgi:hypothetical protein
VIAWSLVCRYTDDMACEWGWFRQESGWRRWTMRRRAVVEGPGRRPCGGEGRPRCLGHQLGHGQSTPGTWAASTRSSVMGLEDQTHPVESTSAKSWRRPGRGRSDTWHTVRDRRRRPSLGEGQGVEGRTRGVLKRVGGFPPKPPPKTAGFPVSPKTAGGRLRKADAWRHHGVSVEAKQSGGKAHPSDWNLCIFPVLPLRAL